MTCPYFSLFLYVRRPPLRFALLCVVACRLVVLSRLRFELIETARFSDSLPPRSSSSHAVMTAARRPCSNQAVLPTHPLFASARPRFSPHRAASSDAPPTRPAYRGTERGLLLGGFVFIYMASCGVICLTFLLYISHSCYISGVLVISFVFLLYIGCSCYILSVPVIWLAFLLYVSYSCYINLFRVILFCRDNAIMGRCV